MSDSVQAAQAVQTLLSQAGSPEAVTRMVAQLLGRFFEGAEAEPDPRAHPAFRRLRRERDLFARRNHLIARALGACDCWGGDVRCARCRGQGAPGYFAPDEDLLVDVLAPLLDLRPEALAPLLGVAATATPKPVSVSEEKE
jgi:hypothetical protein